MNKTAEEIINSNESFVKYYESMKTELIKMMHEYAYQFTSPLSDEISEFAKSMEAELLANSNKGDWRKFKDPQGIYGELAYHEKKLHDAVANNDLPLIKEHIADCANFLLMLGNSFNLY